MTALPGRGPDPDGPEPQHGDDPAGTRSPLGVVRVPTPHLTHLAGSLGSFVEQDDDAITARIPDSWVESSGLDRAQLADDVRASASDALGRLLAALARRDDVAPDGEDGPPRGRR